MIATEPASFLQADPSQPQGQFTEADLRSLGESMRVVGEFQPAVPRPSGTLVCGERLYRAARLVGLTELAVIVTDRPLSETVARLIQLAENVRRADLGDAVPALIKAGESSGPALGLAAIQTQAQIATPVLAAEGKRRKPKGIERTGDEALRMIDQFEVFYWIGALCRKRYTDAFSYTDLQAVLPDLVTRSKSLSSSSLRRHVEKVSGFFRAYYKRYDGIDVPDDEDKRVADADKFVARYNGARRQIIGKIGWRAWEETKRYLTGRGVSLKPITRSH